jgi:hypothetical protein
MYVTGKFREMEQVVEAIRAVRALGAMTVDLDVFSEEPLELLRGVLERPSRMSLVSVSGAIMFGVLATAFIYWTQNDYRLETGGMPVFSFWATGVITFEMTMLGAIVATFAWFLWESGLASRRGRGAPVPMVDPGTICLRVRCRGWQTMQAVEAMQRAGAMGIDRTES